MMMHTINLIKQRNNGSGPYWIAYEHPCVNLTPIKDDHDTVVDYILDGYRMGDTQCIDEKDNMAMTVYWDHTGGVLLMFGEEEARDAMWIRLKDCCIDKKELHKICGA